MRPFWFRDWSGKTTVILASGPSLTLSDVAYVEQARLADRCRVIAINGTFRRAPFADVLYGCDCQWWNANPDHASFRGLRVGLYHARGHAWPSGVFKCEYRDRKSTGLDLEPPYLSTGQNSGYQAINLAVHFGARRILGLGFDFKRSGDGRRHWHGDHPLPLMNPQDSVFPDWLKAMETLPAALAEIGAEFINCSRDTALNCFPRSTIDAEL